MAGYKAMSVWLPMNQINGHQHKAGENAARAEDQCTAQAHHVAQAEDEADGVEAEDHPALVGEGAHHRHELKVEILLPHMECGDKEVVNTGDGGCLQKQLGLRAALFAGHQHFGDGRRLGKGQLAVHLARKVAAQRNEEEHAQAAARQADEDGLHRVRIEMEDIERGKREDGAGHHAA